MGLEKEERREKKSCAGTSPYAHALIKRVAVSWTNVIGRHK